MFLLLRLTFEHVSHIALVFQVNAKWVYSLGKCFGEQVNAKWVYSCMSVFF